MQAYAGLVFPAQDNTHPHEQYQSAPTPVRDNQYLICPQHMRNVVRLF